MTYRDDQREALQSLVKPARAELRTNLLINTNRRTYHLELSSTAQTWLASVSWQYPLDQLTSLKTANAHALTASPIAEGVALERLNFAYEISGDRPPWRPIRAFDDGEKVYLQFPADIALRRAAAALYRGRQRPS